MDPLCLWQCSSSWMWCSRSYRVNFQSNGISGFSTISSEMLWLPQRCLRTALTSLCTQRMSQVLSTNLSSTGSRLTEMQIGHFNHIFWSECCICYPWAPYFWNYTITGWLTLSHLTKANQIPGLCGEYPALPNAAFHRKYSGHVSNRRPAGAWGN